MTIYKSSIILFLTTIVHVGLIGGQVSPSLICGLTSCESASCEPTAEECNIQNATHSGTWLPSADICNCCDYCLVHIAEGEICSKGTISSPPTGSVCGPGLTCETAIGKDYAICVRMKSECHDAQDLYLEKRQNGKLGFLEMEPICDGEGLYGPNKCIPGQTCVCLSNSGRRIFGERANDKGIANMNCACSRNWLNTRIHISDLSISTRCLNDGDFDPLQCIGNRCFCVRRDTGQVSASVIADLNTESLRKLPCFDPELHVDRIYYKKCEGEFKEMITEVSISEDEGFSIIGDPKPNCLPDGSYGLVQVRGNKTMCVDEEGELIEDYELDLKNPAALTMTCKCARTFSLLMKSSGVMVLPTCCKNGNWSPVQCRRGYCYCVDGDGFQTEKEVAEADIKNLSCNTNDWKTC